LVNDLKNLVAKQYGLALHTTTPELGLAISGLAISGLALENFASDSRSQVWNLEREMSSHLHQYLIEFIKPQSFADLAFIAVAKGPGGFTGTRIGVVTARTLGQQLFIPVFAVSTLEAFAWKYLQSMNEDNKNKAEQIIAVKMPAQRGQIFAGIYQPRTDGFGLTALLPDTVFTPEAWEEKLSSLNSNYQLIEASSGLAATVTDILQLALLEWQQDKRPEWAEALPYYGMHPVEI
jgi:tRNA threonylcarbamoyl adenosine modification protein YeaZ